MANIGRIDSASLKNIPNVAPPIPQQTASANVGPTNQWARLAQIGVGKVQQLQLAARMQMAASTKNPVAFQNANRQNNQNNARIAGNETALGTPAKVATGGFHALRSVAGEAARPFELVGQQIGRQVKHLAGPTATQQQQSNILRNQATAQKNPEYIKATKGITGIPAQARIQAQSMAAKGAKAPQLRSYLSQQSKALENQYKRGAGAGLEIASYGVGVPELKGVYEAGKLVKMVRVAKGTAVNAGAGAAGSAGAQLSAKPTSNKSELLKAGGQGAAVGALLTGAAGGLGKLKDIFHSGPQRFLQKVATNRVLEKGRELNQPTKIPVKGGGEATNVTIRTPQRMNDVQFHSEFSKLSSQYDKEVASLQKQVETKVLTRPKTAITLGKSVSRPPVDGYAHSSELVKEYASMLKGTEEGNRGGIMVEDAHEPGAPTYTRISEHGNFYREYYKEHGRAPSERAWKEEAQKELEAGKGAYGASDTYKQLKARESSTYNPKAETKANRILTSTSGKREQILSDIIDAKYQARLNDLLHRYHNPELSPAKSTISNLTSDLKEMVSQGKLKPSVRDVPTHKLKLGSDTVSDTLDTKTVAQYKADIKNGKSIPPIVVSRDANGNVFVQDGAHRLQAAKELGIGKVPTIEQTARLARPTANKLKLTKAKGTAVPSQTGQRVQASAIERGMEADVADVREHVQLNMKEQAQKAADLLNNDPERVADIISGKRSVPSGIHPMAVFNAAKAQALQNADGEMLRQLSHSPLLDIATAGGQTLRVLREGSATDPVSLINQIIKERARTAEVKMGQSVAKATTKLVKEASGHIKSPTKLEWTSFIEGIKC